MSNVSTNDRSDNGLIDPTRLMERALRDFLNDDDWKHLGNPIPMGPNAPTDSKLSVIFGIGTITSEGEIKRAVLFAEGSNVKLLVDAK